MSHYDLNAALFDVCATMEKRIVANILGTPDALDSATTNLKAAIVAYNEKLEEMLERGRIQIPPGAAEMFNIQKELTKEQKRIAS